MDKFLFDINANHLTLCDGGGGGDGERQPTWK